MKQITEITSEIHKQYKDEKKQLEDAFTKLLQEDELQRQSTWCLRLLMKFNTPNFSFRDRSNLMLKRMYFLFNTVHILKLSISCLIYIKNTFQREYTYLAPQTNPLSPKCLLFPSKNPTALLLSHLNPKFLNISTKNSFEKSQNPEQIFYMHKRRPGANPWLLVKLPLQLYSFNNLSIVCVGFHAFVIEREARKIENKRQQRLQLKNKVFSQVRDVDEEKQMRIGQIKEGDVLFSMQDLEKSLENQSLEERQRMRLEQLERIREEQRNKVDPKTIEFDLAEYLKNNTNPQSVFNIGKVYKNSPLASKENKQYLENYDSANSLAKKGNLKLDEFKMNSSFDSLPKKPDVGKIKELPAFNRRNRSNKSMISYSTPSKASQRRKINVSNRGGITHKVDTEPTASVSYDSRRVGGTNFHTSSVRKSIDTTSNPTSKHVLILLVKIPSICRGSETTTNSSKRKNLSLCTALNRNTDNLPDSLSKLIVKDLGKEPDSERKQAEGSISGVRRGNSDGGRISKRNLSKAKEDLKAAFNFDDTQLNTLMEHPLIHKKLNTWGDQLSSDYISQLKRRQRQREYWKNRVRNDFQPPKQAIEEITKKKEEKYREYRK
ncbi:unnamed protein product [Moneuplotes crassus]|uniref:Uncharacterized protein n=1 Tax=Euplotes crassus TaxID=5936 RepID=A0AAD2DAA6_EUPCR|nr:unnamed protein product [Moneuplotes crassus]